MFDLAMRRFIKKGSRVSITSSLEEEVKAGEEEKKEEPNLFRRGDGTLAYFFKKEEV